MRITTLLFFCLAFFGGISLNAQTVEFGGMDKSPMDAAHYPRRAAFKNYLSADDPDTRQIIKVLYSRPNKNDRDVFGTLEPFGQDWRLGANEATEVTFFQAVEIGNTTIPAGTYTMFAQLYPEQWIIKISEERFLAGAGNRDVSKDLVAVPVTTHSTGNAREAFTIGFQKVDDNQVNMIFEWDKTRASLPINLNPPSMAGSDASPMDLIQFPARSRMLNFVEEADKEANQPQVRVVYSRPQMKGRKIFGDLIPTDGSMWRLGANETTLVTLFMDAKVGDTDVKAGTYGLFARVMDNEWEYVLHKSTQSWGNANFDEKDIVATYKTKTEKTPTTLEGLSATMMDVDGTIHLVFGWENTMARLPIMMKK